MRTDPRFRTLAWLLGIFWVLLAARAVQVQLIQHRKWEQEADLMRRAIEKIPAARGEIRSADGLVLARSVLNWSLGVDPKNVKDPLALAVALDSLGLVEPAEFIHRIESHRSDRFLWINRDILSESRLGKLRQRFPSLSLRTEGKRLYALGRAGGATLGLLGRDEVPLGGLESVFNEKLKGRDGRLLRISDAADTCFQGIQVQVLEDPVSGASLELTLDSRLQEIASARLEAGVEREGASSGFCILTRPATGEILAMVSVPTVDPESPETWNAATLKVHPVADVYEPGSSFKLVAFAANLEAGLFNPEEPIDCMRGRRQVPGGKPITDHEPYGVLKAWEVLAHSSNIGTGLLAERVGPERFYQMEKAFGFGLPSGIQLPGEGQGRIPEPSPSKWSARSLVTMAFGQEISCTGIQMAMAYGAVANGGTLMRPLLTRALRAPDGAILERMDPEAVRPVLRPEVARELRDLLRRVVTDGTGKKAEIPEFTPAGKTSTAQKFIPEDGQYSNRRYIASFIGFAPAQDPQILCLVLLDEPTSSIYGGNVAAPIFREILIDAMPILAGAGLLPSPTPPPVVRLVPDTGREVPSVSGLTPALACRVVQEAGFLPRLLGEGVRVVSGAPGPGERLPSGSVVTLQLGGGAASPESLGLPMPDVRGLCLRDALLRLRSVEARAQVAGAGWVLSQYPEPGAPLTSGQSCSVTLGPDSCRAYKEYLDSESRASRAVVTRDLLVGASR